MKNPYSKLPPLIQTLYTHYDENTWYSISKPEIFRLLTGFLEHRQKDEITFFVQLPTSFGDRLREFCIEDEGFYLSVRQVLRSHNLKMEKKYEILFEPQWVWKKGEEYLISQEYSDMDFWKKERI